MRAVGALLPMGLVFILLSGTLLRAQEEKAPSDSVAAYPLPIPALSPSPVIQPKQQTFSRVADQNFWLLTGITYAATVADIEMTQRCIGAGTCHEGNPIVSNNRAVAYPVQLGVTSGFTAMSYYLKKRKVNWWWLPQATITAAHGAGISFGVRFAW